jgi:hypothetical protein
VIIGVDTFAGRFFWSVVMGDFFLNTTESDLFSLGVPGVFFLEEATGIRGSLMAFLRFGL